MKIKNYLKLSVRMAIMVVGFSQNDLLGRMNFRISMFHEVCWNKPIKGKGTGEVTTEGGTEVETGGVERVENRRMHNSCGSVTANSK